MSGRGLYGDDLNSFIKRAGDDLATQVRKLAYHADEPLLHILALGSTERTGPNRNGDGWRHLTLRELHKTFEKNARLYRNHANKLPAKSYGRIKLAWYNEPMQRVELVVGLNGSPEAARRNGGLFADEEMAKLARDDFNWATSMAFSCPRDKCSSCGHWARSRAEYCLGVDEGGLCKHGGLRHHIGRIGEDGHHLHADNPEGYFIDISTVERGADPTSHVLGVFDKQALDLGAGCGAALGERLCGYDAAELAEPVARRLEALQLLKEAEGRVARQNAAVVHLALPIDRLPAPPFLASLGFRKTAAQVHDCLLGAQLVPVLEDYEAWFENKQAALLDRPAEALPGVYGRLAAAGLTADLLSGRFEPDRCASHWRGWGAKIAAEFSLEAKACQQRLRRALLHGGSASSVPTAAPRTASADHCRRAEKYATYKVIWLADRLPNLEAGQDERLAELLVRHDLLQARP